MFGRRLLFKKRPTVKVRACQKVLIGDGFTSDNTILQEKSHNFMVLRELGPAEFPGRHYPLRPSLTAHTPLLLLTAISASCGF